MLLSKRKKRFWEGSPQIIKSFTEAIRLDIKEFLVNNCEALDGTDLNIKDASDEAKV